MLVTVSYGQRAYGTGSNARKYSVTVGDVEWKREWIGIDFGLKPPVPGKNPSWLNNAKVSAVRLELPKNVAVALAKAVLQTCKTKRRSKDELSLEVDEGGA